MVLLRLLAAVDEGQLKKEQISIANLLAITAFKDAASDALIKKHWGRLTKSSEEKEEPVWTAFSTVPYLGPLALLVLLGTASAAARPARRSSVVRASWADPRE